MLRNTIALLFIPFVCSQCGPGAEFYTETNKCFQYFKVAVDYQSAEEVCETFNGHLTSIHNSNENDYLARQAEKYIFADGAVWLGAAASSSDVSKPSNWHWTDGSKFDYQDYRSGQPSPLETAACMQFLVGTGKWLTASCSNAYPFICAYEPLSIPATCAPPKVDSCPSRYVWFAQTDSCYKPVIKPVTFAEAFAACQAEGAQLASVHSDQENDFLVGLTKTGVSNIPDTVPVHHDGIYIGLVYQNNVWQWTDGSSKGYSNWATGEPSNSGSQFWTILMPDPYNSNYNKNGKQWKNVNNGTQRGYICKRPAIV